MKQLSLEARREACYLICEMGPFTGMAVDMLPQELLAQTTFLNQ